MIEDSLIKDNKDINKEMYKLFTLKEDPKEVKDMYLLRYFFNKFKIDIGNFPIFKENLFMVKNQIHEAALYSHNDLKRRYNIDYEFSGTSLCSCLIFGETLYTINIGDCGIILGQFSNFNRWEVKSLCKRHTFDDTQEKARIIANGGRFNENKNKSQAEFIPFILYDKDKEIDFQGLTVSRSIGDNHAKKLGISYEPEVNKYTLNKNDKIIIIGNNIIWKYLNDEEIIKILGSFYLDDKSAEEAALYLTELIRNKSQKKNSYKRQTKINQNLEITNESKKKV
jgi:serine/threonine protein phosphatase PrpC